MHPYHERDGPPEVCTWIHVGVANPREWKGAIGDRHGLHVPHTSIVDGGRMHMPAALLHPVPTMTTYMLDEASGDDGSMYVLHMQQLLTMATCMCASCSYHCTGAGSAGGDPQVADPQLWSFAPSPDRCPRIERSFLEVRPCHLHVRSLTASFTSTRHLPNAGQLSVHEPAAKRIFWLLLYLFMPGCNSLGA